MRDLAAFASLILFLAGLYAVAAPGSDALRTARLADAVTLTATR